MRWGEVGEGKSQLFLTEAAIKCENTEERKFKKCKVMGRVTIDVAGEVNRGYILRVLQTMVMILEINVKGNGESLDSL